MPDYQAMFKQIGDQIISLAETTVSKYKDEAIADAKQVVAGMKEDLIRWTDLLAQGKLTTAEFEWMINSEKELLKMKALEKAGLAMVRIQQFAMSVLNLIADVALKAALAAL